MAKSIFFVKDMDEDEDEDSDEKSEDKEINVEIEPIVSQPEFVHELPALPAYAKHDVLEHEKVSSFLLDFCKHVFPCRCETDYSAA